MDTFEPLLVAVDSRGLATDAVVAGFVLAERLGARLEFLHVAELSTHRWPRLTPAQLAGIRERTLTAARRKVRANLVHPLFQADVPIARLDEHLSVEAGHPAETILLKARELGAGLIVLGPHERRLLFDQGGTARAVLAGAGVPVWTQVEATETIERILVPVDFSEHSRVAVTCAHALARCLDASLRILHCFVPAPFARAEPAGLSDAPGVVVDQERKAALEELQRIVDAHAHSPVEVVSELVEETPLEGIHRLGRAHDLVVMGTQGRTGLARFLLGSTAHGVLRMSQKPVLLVPHPDRAWLLEDPVRAQVPLAPSTATESTA